MENDAASKTMMLVLQDNNGDYFLVPQETLERGRIQAERKAEIEQLLATQADVQGYLTDAEKKAMNGVVYAVGVWTNILGLIGMAVRPGR